MSETKSLTLSGVPETLLIPLYNRAMESQRPDAMVKDEKAVELVTKMPLDFSRVRQIPMTELLKVMRIMFTREFDRYARDFLDRHPGAVVVHLGCGLDSRFERVDNGYVEWYDLDLPEVIELRRKLISDEGERYHLLAPVRPKSHCCRTARRAAIMPPCQRPRPPCSPPSSIGPRPHAMPCRGRRWSLG